MFQILVGALVGAGALVAVDAMRDGNKSNSKSEDFSSDLDMAVAKKQPKADSTALQNIKVAVQVYRDTLYEHYANNEANMSMFANTNNGWKLLAAFNNQKLFKSYRALLNTMVSHGVTKIHLKDFNRTVDAAETIPNSLYVKNIAEDLQYYHENRNNAKTLIGEVLNKEVNNEVTFADLINAMNNGNYDEVMKNAGSIRL